jgi:hypothetical protein
MPTERGASAGPHTVIPSVGWPYSCVGEGNNYRKNGNRRHPYNSKTASSGFEEGLRDLLNLTGPDARRADTEAFTGAVDQSPHGLQVHVPAAFGDIVGVADAVSELRTAATNFAYFRHSTEISLRLNL